MEVRENTPGAIGTAIIKKNAESSDLRQERIFTNWANFILLRRNLRIRSVKEDMASGVLLIQLVEILCDAKVPRYNKRPTMLVHQIENITIAMAFLKQHGFDSSTVAPADVAKGDPKSILGMFWLLIAHFQLRDLRNKWQSGSTQDSAREKEADELETEIAALKAENEQRKNQGEERRKRREERAAKRKAAIISQNKFNNKLQAFKKWTEAKCAELNTFQPGLTLNELETQKKLMDADDTSTREECKNHREELGKLWEEFLKCEPEDPSTTIADGDACVAALDEALKNRRKAYDGALQAYYKAQEGEKKRIEEEKRRLKEEAEKERIEEEKRRKEEEERRLEEDRRRKEEAEKRIEEEKKRKEEERNKAQQAFDCAAKDYQNWVNATSAGLEGLNPTANSVVELKQALDRMVRNNSELTGQNNKLRDDLHALWEDLKKHGASPVQPAGGLVLADVDNLHDKLEDEIKKKKREADALIEQKQKEEAKKKSAAAVFAEEVQKYKSWGNDKADALRNAPLMAPEIREENDRRKNQLNAMFEDLKRCPGDNSQLKNLCDGLSPDDVAAIHKEVDQAVRDSEARAKAQAEAAKAFADAAKKYEKWAAAQNTIRKKFMGPELDDMTPDTLRVQGTEWLKQLEEMCKENDKQKARCEDLWDDVTQYGPAPADKCGNLSPANLREWHDAVQKVLDGANKDYHDALAELEKREAKKQETEKVFAEAVGGYASWAKQRVREADSHRDFGTTLEGIDKTKKQLEVIALEIRNENDRRKHQVEDMIPDLPPNEQQAKQQELEEIHQSVVRALYRQAEAIQKDVKRVEDAQGLSICKELDIGGSMFVRRKADPTEAKNPCKKCTLPLEQSNVVLVDGVDLYHATCFICSTCKCEFEKYYWEFHNNPYCHPHYAEVAGLICGGCGKLILEDKLTLADNRKWHTVCFVCTTCCCAFEGGYYLHEDQPYCYLDFMKAKGLLCTKCGEPVGQGDKSWEKKPWHRKCWTCTICNRPFGAEGFFGWEGKPYCAEDYKKVRGK